MPPFAIKDYEKHDEHIKRVCLKFYEWALDHNINRYLLSHYLVSASSLPTSTTTTKPSRPAGTSWTLSPPNISARQSFSKTPDTTPNTKYSSLYLQGPFYPKYVAVMVQYVAKINTEKLNKEIKNVQNQKGEEKAGKQHFHFRLVEDKESSEMTGYEHNGVVPVLMKTR